MGKRYLVIFSLVLFFVVLRITTRRITCLRYDDFSGNYIDKARWQEGERVIEIDTGSQKLLSKLASINPVGISIYPHVDVNPLNFINPNSVNSFQADVTLLEASIINSAAASPRLDGFFYNDGTPGAGMIGDIYAMVTIGRDTNGELVGKAQVVRETNADATSWEYLWTENFSVSVAIGTPYTLYLAYDSTAEPIYF